MKEIIDLNSWKRKDNFSFFKNFYNPYISVTCNVCCKKIKLQSIENNESFFLNYLYAILNAINEIDEFKYRIDQNGNIVKYDKIDVLTPIKNPNLSNFITVRIPFYHDKSLFYCEAKKIITEMTTTSPYSAEENCLDFDVVLLSAIPTLPFTSITCTQKHRNGNDYPLINIGKLNDEFNMPIAVSVHHGFVDGEHIAHFFQVVQNSLNRY